MAGPRFTISTCLIWLFAFLPAAAFAAAGPDPLLRAASRGDLAEVERRIAGGADIDRSDDRGRTALMFAAYNGHQPVVERLVRAGADVNRQSAAGYTALMYAVFQNRRPAVRFLLEHDADLRPRNREKRNALDIARALQRPLLVRLIRTEYLGGRLLTALQNQDDRQARELLQLDADPEMRDDRGRSLLVLAILSGRNDIARRLVLNGARVPLPAPGDETPGEFESPLAIAAERGELELFRFLLTRGKSRARPEPPLHWAIEHGQTGILRSLLKRPETSPTLLSEPGKNKTTPLGYALLRDRADYGRLLLRAGANPDGSGGEWNPLLIAVQRGHFAFARRLLRRGASVPKAEAATEKRSERSLLWLVAGENPGNEDAAKMFTALLDAGADPDLPGPRGSTLLMEAIRTGDRPRTLQLLKAGCDVNRPDRKGHTVLHHVAYRQPDKKALAVARLLVRFGADPNLPGNQDRSALWWAVYGRKKKLTALLKSAGGDFNRHDAFGDSPADLIARRK